MLRKVKKFVRKHFHSGEGTREPSKGGSRSIRRILRHKSTPDLTQSISAPYLHNPGHYQMPQPARFNNVSLGGYPQGGEVERNGSMVGYSQSLGELTITNPDPSPVESTVSLASTFSNLSDYDPGPLGHLVTAAKYRKRSDPAASRRESFSSNSSRISNSEFCSMSDDLTAAIFTTAVSPEGSNSPENSSEAMSPRQTMNGLKMHPPSIPMRSAAIPQASRTPLHEQADVKTVSLISPVQTDYRKTSSPGQVPCADDEEAVSGSVNSAAPVGTPTPLSRLGSYPQSREEDDSISVKEHIQGRIKERRSTDCFGLFTTAEFPEELHTLGPYSRFPGFTHSSDYQYPHDQPFDFAGVETPPDDNDHDLGMSANLTRDSIADYAVERHSSTTGSVHMDHPDDADREIYKHAQTLNNPILYMHTRYPRHLPSQLVVAAPNPSRGPVKSRPIHSRISHSLIDLPPRRRSRRQSATRTNRFADLMKSSSRMRKRRRSQIRRLGSLSNANRGQQVRGYHAFMYNSMRRQARQWNDYALIETSRNNSIASTVAAAQGPIAASVSRERPPLTSNADTVIPPQTASSGPPLPYPTTPTRIPTIPGTPPRRPALTLCTSFSRSYSDLRLRQDSRIMGLSSAYQPGQRWLEQNNTNDSPQEHFNIS